MDDREGEINRLPLISVIIPVYGGEKYIHECINSVLGQTYKNIECILVDGDSPDNCPYICEEYAEKDQRVKVIHKKNRGLGDDRNVGLRDSKGEYITFVDVDDVIALDMISQLYGLCVKYKVLLAQCNHFTQNREFDTIKDGQLYGKKLKKEKCMIELLGNYCVSFCVTWGKLFHRSLFENVTFPCWKLNEDVYTTHLLFEAAGEIVFTYKRLYYYRQHENSLMSKQHVKPRIERVTANIERTNFFATHGYEDALKVHIKGCLNMTRYYYCEYYMCWSSIQKQYLRREYRKLFHMAFRKKYKDILVSYCLFYFMPEIYCRCKKKVL